jgi:hypothetical protein
MAANLMFLSDFVIASQIDWKKFATVETKIPV